jgi:uncharacterized protein YukE
MAEIGMDPAEVRKVAVSLDGQAGVLASVVGQLDGLVDHLHQVWFGQDAQAFADWWRHQHRLSLMKAHDAIAGLAQSARNNATAQDDTSAGQGSTTAMPATSAPAPARIAFSASQPATPAAIAAIDTMATNTLAHAGKHFPGASAQIKEWQQRIDAGDATSADVESFHRYLLLVNLASMQRSTVSDAAGLAVSSLNDASTAGLAAALGVATLGHGEGAGAVGKDSAKVLGEKALAHGVTGGLNDSLTGAEQNALLSAVTGHDPNKILSAYDSSADTYLQSVAAQVGSAPDLHHVDTQTVIASSGAVLDGRLEQQGYSSDAADSTNLITGDGSTVQNIEANILSSAPVVGPIFGAAQTGANAAHSDLAFNVGVASLKVASVDSVNNLRSTAQELELTPR